MTAYDLIDAFGLHTPRPLGEERPLDDEEILNAIRVHLATVELFNRLECVERWIKLLDAMDGCIEEVCGKYDGSTPLTQRPSYKIERNKARIEMMELVKQAAGDVLDDLEDGADDI